VAIEVIERSGSGSRSRAAWMIASGHRIMAVLRFEPRDGHLERYHAMAARAIALPDPGDGGPDVLMRHE
jgi:hypothetical protein